MEKVIIEAIIEVFPESDEHLQSTQAIVEEVKSLFENMGAIVRSVKVSPGEAE
jgi:hypothetical protein